MRDIIGCPASWYLPLVCYIVSSVFLLSPGYGCRRRTAGIDCKKRCLSAHGVHGTSTLTNPSGILSLRRAWSRVLRRRRLDRFSIATISSLLSLTIQRNAWNWRGPKLMMSCVSQRLGTRCERSVALSTMVLSLCFSVTVTI